MESCAVVATATAPAPWRLVCCCQQQQEIRVCTHTTCRRSGSLQTLELIRNLAPANVSVQSCACLGRCGSGPNLVLLPQQLMVSYCNTAAHAARFLALQCGAHNPDNNLAALALTQGADKAVELGELDKACSLYTKAIELNPSGGLPSIYVKRSAALLAIKDAQKGLEDAKMASQLSPLWPVPYLKQADAYAAMADYNAAKQFYSVALNLDSTLRRSKSFQRKLLELDNKASSSSDVA